jgi:Guanylyl transferase CofC like
MSTDRRRLAVVLARHEARPGTPPGIDPDAFAGACLADSYEVVAGLTGVAAGIAGPPAVRELLWPGDRWWPADVSVATLAVEAAETADELIMVPADVPDLPALVLAKIFKALLHADVVIAPQRGGDGCVALGLSLPVAGWVAVESLDLDRNPYEALAAAAPGRRSCAVTPDWHRLRTPDSVHGLDPGLEGWEETRALLSGSPLPRP